MDVWFWMLVWMFISIPMEIILLLKSNKLVPNFQLGVYGLSESHLAVLSDWVDECSHPYIRDNLTGFLGPQHDRDQDKWIIFF